MNDPFLLATSIDLTLFIKIPFLILIVLYVIFALVLLNKVRSLGKMVFISHFGITVILDSIAFIHLLASISLFFITLVIL